MDPAARSAPRAWRLPQLVAFRFGFLVALLFVFPFPIGVIPKTWWLADALNKPWEWGVSWFATAVLGIEAPSRIPTGSGDTTWAFVQLLMIATLAVLGTTAWSLGCLRRRPPSHARLAAGTIVVLRYYVASMLVSYGFAKIFNHQFPAPSPIRFDHRVGDMSPMGLLWTFMGSSQPYTIFSGVAEVLAGVLLLSRRTTVIGALIAAAVMTNVVLLNLCYDVPVKLFSMRLLGFLVAIVLPSAPAVIRALLGRATPESPPRVRLAPRWERARRAAKLALIGAFAYNVYAQVTLARLFDAPRSELYGLWAVDQLSIDDVERPPLVTDGARWRTLAVGRGVLGIRSMTDERQVFRAQIDRGEIRVTIGDQIEIWRYAVHAGDRVTLTIDGRLREHRVRATLTLQPEPLLVTRGFHWIQDEPFNR